MREGIEEIYSKVHTKLQSFKIDHGVEVQGSLVIGWFEPAEPKAIAREFGGKSYYLILPHKSRLLRFFGQKDGALVFVSSVFHPPSREFRDIRDALEVAIPRIEAEIEAGIQGILP